MSHTDIDTSVFTVFKDLRELILDAAHPGRGAKNQAQIESDIPVDCTGEQPLLESTA